MNENFFIPGRGRLLALLGLSHIHQALTIAELQPMREAHCGVIASILGDERVKGPLGKLRRGSESVLTHAEWRGS